MYACAAHGCMYGVDDDDDDAMMMMMDEVE